MAIVYKIKKGDTLQSLAKLGFGVPADILKANPGIKNLKPGMTIKLPSYGFSKAPTGGYWNPGTGTISSGRKPIQKPPPRWQHYKGAQEKGGKPQPRIINVGGVLKKNPLWKPPPTPAPPIDYTSQFIAGPGGNIIKNPNYGKKPVKPPKPAPGYGLMPDNWKGQKPPPKYPLPGGGPTGSWMDFTKIPPGMTWDEYNTRLYNAQQQGYKGPWLRPGPDGKPVLGGQQQSGGGGFTPIKRTQEQYNAEMLEKIENAPVMKVTGFDASGLTDWFAQHPEVAPIHLQGILDALNMGDPSSATGFLLKYISTHNLWQFADEINKTIQWTQEPLLGGGGSQTTGGAGGVGGAGQQGTGNAQNQGLNWNV